MKTIQRIIFVICFYITLTSNVFAIGSTVISGGTGSPLAITLGARF